MLRSRYAPIFFVADSGPPIFIMSCSFAWGVCSMFLLHDVLNSSQFYHGRNLTKYPFFVTAQNRPSTPFFQLRVNLEALF